MRLITTFTITLIRPLSIAELIESVMYLYRATEDPFLLEVAVDMLEAIESSTRTRCGYASVSGMETK